MTETYILRIDAPSLGSITVEDPKALPLASQFLKQIMNQQEIKENTNKKESKKQEESISTPINGIREKQIMNILWEFPESTCKEIASDIVLTTSATYILLNKLEENEMIKGLTIKNPQQKGKASKHYSVTEKGRKQYNLKVEEEKIDSGD